MNKHSFLSLLSALLILSAFITLRSVNWKVSDGYAIKFTSENPSGVFTKLDGTIAFDPANLATSKCILSVDVASINTGNGMKNRHAKSDKWFDAEKYPVITFASNTFARTKSGYEVTGTLDMHGVKKEVIIPFTFTNDIFAGSFTVNRLDYNIGTTKGMSGRAASDLNVDVSVPVVRQ